MESGVSGVGLVIGTYHEEGVMEGWDKVAFVPTGKKRAEVKVTWALRRERFISQTLIPIFR